jgi:hypothetical protein
MSDAFSSPLLLAVVVGGLTILGTVIGSYATARFALRTQVDIRKRENRERFCSAIMGRKFLLTQLYLSRFEASILSIYHEHKWRVARAATSSSDLDEAGRWMAKSENLALECARAHESLFESIGLARAAYPQSAELNRLTNRLYQFRVPDKPAQPKVKDIKELLDWRDAAIRDIEQIMNQELAQPIDELIKYLGENMEAGSLTKTKARIVKTLVALAVLSAVVVAGVAYMGAHHGWDRHSYAITIPFWSGPSDEEIRARLVRDGTTDVQILDRWTGITSEGDIHCRKGTPLYGVRVKGKFTVGSVPEILDAYFYKDDFGQLHSYGYRPIEGGK